MLDSSVGGLAEETNQDQDSSKVTKHEAESVFVVFDDVSDSLSLWSQDQVTVFICFKSGFQTMFLKASLDLFGKLSSFDWALAFGRDITLLLVAGDKEQSSKSHRDGPDDLPGSLPAKGTDEGSNRKFKWFLEESNEAVENIGSLSMLGSKVLAYLRVERSLDASLADSYNDHKNEQMGSFCGKTMGKSCSTPCNASNTKVELLVEVSQGWRTQHQNWKISNNKQ